MSRERTNATLNLARLIFVGHVNGPDAPGGEFETHRAVERALDLAETFEAVAGEYEKEVR